MFLRQRVRWARGLVQTLYLHKSVFFNPIWKNRFISISILCFFMSFVPILEVIGIIVLILTFVFQYKSWLLIDRHSFVYLFYITITLISVFLDQIIYKHYTGIKEVLILIFMILLNPSHSILLTYMLLLKGIGIFWTKEQNGGTQVRQGFNNANIEKWKNNIYCHIDNTFKLKHTSTKSILIAY
jgi:cellulose synthase/poly-beta-1,6-N-acetylglucosamine synthase-like glycosyltransferase